MSAVSVAGAWPGAGRPFTVEELDRMPDDGHRYELLDGALVVSPRPGMRHQAVAGELFFVLRLACPQGLRVVPEPAVQLSAYEQFGVPSHWIMVPDPAAPELITFEHLIAGRTAGGGS
jgi:hypothetical protein